MFESSAEDLISEIEDLAGAIIADAVETGAGLDSLEDAEDYLYNNLSRIEGTAQEIITLIRAYERSDFE